MLAAWRARSASSHLAERLARGTAALGERADLTEMDRAFVLLELAIGRMRVVALKSIKPEP